MAGVEPAAASWFSASTRWVQPTYICAACEAEPMSSHFGFFTSPDAMPNHVAHGPLVRQPQPQPYQRLPWLSEHEL